MSNILVDTKINCKNLLVFLISIFPISFHWFFRFGLAIIIDLLFLFLIIKEKKI